MKCILLILPILHILRSYICIIIPYTTLPFKPSSLTSFLEYNIEINLYNIPSIQIEFGSHSQKINIFISTLENKICISSYKYDLSSTYTEKSELLFLDHLQPNLQGKSALDTITIGESFQLKQFPFIRLLAEDFQYFFKGFIGFGFSFIEEQPINSNTEYNILFQLKSRKIIDKHIISQHVNPPLMLIGEYPQFPSVVNQFNYKTAPLIVKKLNGERNDVWQIMLYSVYLKNGLFVKVNAAMTISFGGNVIGVSKELFSSIVDQYFFYDLSNDYCKIVDGLIQCFPTASVIRTAMEINLVLGKWSLKIRNKELFQPTLDSGKSYFIIVESQSKTGGKWTLGTNMFKNIQPVLDGDKNEFGVLFLGDKLNQS